MVTAGLISNIFNPALITVRLGIKPDKNRDFVVLSWRAYVYHEILRVLSLKLCLKTVCEPL